jgi:hypothetical protein
MFAKKGSDFMSSIPVGPKPNLYLGSLTNNLFKKALAVSENIGK